MGKNSYFILLTGKRKMQCSLAYWEELSEGRCLVLSCFKDSDSQPVGHDPFVVK